MRGCFVASLVVWGASVQAGDGRTPLPAVQKAPAGSQCVAPPAEMRRNHMEMLRHQRDDTVRGGVRGARASLQGCVDCHASALTHSVAKAPGDYCVSCHQYTAVKVDCFECHSGKRQAAR